MRVDANEALLGPGSCELRRAFGMLFDLVEHVLLLHRQRGLRLRESGGTQGNLPKRLDEERARAARRVDDGRRPRACLEPCLGCLGVVEASHTEDKARNFPVREELPFALLELRANRLLKEVAENVGVGAEGVLGKLVAREIADGRAQLLGAGLQLAKRRVDCRPDVLRSTLA